jgi:putative ABC transport system ATP-binding protein
MDLNKKSIVSLKNVDQSFVVGEEKIDVLHDISFDLQPNTFNIIYGPSGSGKSTLLNILSGLQRPSSGTVVFGGSHLYELKPK